MAFKISISDYNFDWYYKGVFQSPRSHPGTVSREEAVAFYGTLEVDAIEFTHVYWTDCPATHLKKLAADVDLPITCYVFGVDFARTPSDLPAEIDKARRLLERSAEMGSPRVMITPVIVKEGVPLGEQRKWMIEGLRASAEHAAKLGVTVCIENLDWPPGRPLTGSGQQVRDICDDVQHPSFRLIYDCGATPFVDDDALAALDTMRPSVAHVHVKNCRRVQPGEIIERHLDSRSGKRYTGTLLDGGIVPIAAVIEKLRSSKYDGYLSIEYQGMLDPRFACQHNVSYLKKLIACG